MSASAKVRSRFARAVALTITIGVVIWAGASPAGAAEPTRQLKSSGGILAPCLASVSTPFVESGNRLFYYEEVTCDPGDYYAIRLHLELRKRDAAAIWHVVDAHDATFATPLASTLVGAIYTNAPMCAPGTRELYQTVGTALLNDGVRTYSAFVFTQYVWISCPSS